METTPLTTELITFVASNRGAAEKLIAEHVNDGRGRCRSCVIGNSAGHMPWPCLLRQVAEAAAAFQRDRK